MSRTYSATAVEQDLFVGSRYVGRYYTFQALNVRIEDEIHYITRSLSFARSGRRIPDNYQIDVFYVTAFQTADGLQCLSKLAVWKHANTIGDRGEFVALHSRGEDGEHAESWCFIFYKAIVYVAYFMKVASYTWVTAQSARVDQAPILGLDSPSLSGVMEPQM